MLRAGPLCRIPLSGGVVAGLEIRRHGLRVIRPMRPSKGAAHGQVACRFVDALDADEFAVPEAMHGQRPPVLAQDRDRFVGAGRHAGNLNLMGPLVAPEPWYARVGTVVSEQTLGEELALVYGIL